MNHTESFPERSNVYRQGVDTRARITEGIQTGMQNWYRSHPLRHRRSNDPHQPAAAIGQRGFSSYDIGQSSTPITTPRVVYRSGMDPDPRNWNWFEWAYVLGYLIIFGVVVAGFILLVITGRKCCL